MKAIRFHGRKDLRLDEIPIPELKSDDIKIKPAYVGICGTDLHEYEDGPIVIPSTSHRVTGEQLPLTLGHEFSGVVYEVGSAVTSYKPGDRVVVQPVIYDGTCGACKQAQINCCYNMGFIGTSSAGGLAEFIVVKESFLFRLPDNVSLDVGAMVEPLAVAWHSTDVANVRPSDSVLILGGGPIGIAVLLCLKAKGISNIIVSEVAAGRKKLATQFGATHVLDPTEDDVAARCRQICDNEGVHVVIDAAGVQSGLDTAIEACRVRATIVNIALWGKSPTVAVNTMIYKEITYKGSAIYVQGDFQQVLDALGNGKIANAKDMITKKIEMSEVDEGFRLLVEDKANQVKILIRVAGGD
ncbi:GroES-like protein [Microthyrium microscopicum]|uniref:GroES-like protein n=1 Tax=Microthyrium microscopicum TaxID=703497 RepID=A0A6A6UM19_9PEZI|nr:GroES-like protein [Microthyrium microscopicum]